MERGSNILDKTIGYILSSKLSGSLRRDLSNEFKKFLSDSLENHLRSSFYLPVHEQSYWSGIFHQLRYESLEDEAV